MAATILTLSFCEFICSCSNKSYILNCERGLHSHFQHDQYNIDNHNLQQDLPVRRSKQTALVRLLSSPRAESARAVTGRRIFGPFSAFRQSVKTAVYGHFSVILAGTGSVCQRRSYFWWPGWSHQVSLTSVQN